MGRRLKHPLVIAADQDCTCRASRILKEDLVPSWRSRELSPIGINSDATTRADSSSYSVAQEIVPRTPYSNNGDSEDGVR